MHWCRRSRGGWRWIDGADAPLVEEREAYRVTIEAGPDGTGGGETLVPGWTVDAATLAAGPVTVSVRQRGTWGDSPAATIIVEGRA